MCCNQYGFGTWLEWNPACFRGISLAADVLARAVIICTDVSKQLLDHPNSLLAQLKELLEYAPICLLTSSDRDSICRRHAERSANPDELSIAELEQMLLSEGFNLEFIGLTASESIHYEKTSPLAVITRDAIGRASAENTPPDFRVVAFMAAYNEEDIIISSIKNWTNQGIAVHILENWSTDATYDLAKQFESEGLVTVERFPKEGPSPYFDWGAILARIDEVTRETEADWFIRRGADEILTTPWPGVNYRKGLYLVDRAGFNCIDHTVIEFQAVDDAFAAGTDHETYFKHYEFAKHPGHFHQRKTWKNFGQAISTIDSGGHDVPFEGRRVFPFKFLLKHYPVRSQKHGEKKVFLERKARWNPDERAKGWHTHYDSVEEGHMFLHPALERELFNEEHFNKAYLVERLSGIGILR
jgi:DNA-dependent RNA polymerase auxiliary subunit epsilon